MHLGSAGGQLAGPSEAADTLYPSVLRMSPFLLGPAGDGEQAGKEISNPTWNSLQTPEPSGVTSQHWKRKQGHRFQVILCHVVSSRLQAMGDPGGGVWEGQDFY